MKKLSKLSRGVIAIVMMCCMSLSLVITSCGDDKEGLKPELSESKLVMKVGEVANVFVYNASTIKSVASSDIVTVAVLGNVAEITAVSIGQATVLISTNGYTFECEVTVESSNGESSETPDVPDSPGDDETPTNPNISSDNSDIFTNLEKDEMVFVEGGTFLMGAQDGDPSAPNYDLDAWNNESPIHQVTLSDYYIGKYEVTQQLWDYVMRYTGMCADGTSMRVYTFDVWLGANPRSDYGLGDYYPAYYVSWEDVVNIFIPRLNKITGKKFRLPTEAEWEYAARGGNKSKGYKYSGSNTLDDVAWCCNNSSSSHIVGTKAPNELGLYDMSGNVWEWCSDWNGNYLSVAQTNPTGEKTGWYRVDRGGAWSDYNTVSCRVAYRHHYIPDERRFYMGFRLVCHK